MSAAPTTGATSGSASKDDLKEKIIAELRTCFDPEIPVNVYDLGLIYGIDVADTGDVRIDMTLTSPNCPSIESLPSEIQQKAESVEGVKSVKLELIWEPPFHTGLMSDEAKLQLGLM